jgi:hypothetical protein
MTNGSGPDHYDDRKNAERKDSAKQAKKAATDRRKAQSATKRAQ